MLFSRFAFDRITSMMEFLVASIIYRTRAIITRGLYIFYPIFHCGLYCRAVSVTYRQFM